MPKAKLTKTGKVGNADPVYMFSSTTTLSFSPHPAKAGNSITITATVEPMAVLEGTLLDDASGTVKITVSKTTETFTLTPGQHSVTLTTPPLPANSYRVKAVYSGDETFTGSDATITMRIQ